TASSACSPSAPCTSPCLPPSCSVGLTCGRCSSRACCCSSRRRRSTNGGGGRVLRLDICSRLFRSAPWRLSKRPDFVPSGWLPGPAHLSDCRGRHVLAASRWMWPHDTGSNQVMDQLGILGRAYENALPSVRHGLTTYSNVAGILLLTAINVPL